MLSSMSSCSDDEIEYGADSSLEFRSRQPAMVVMRKVEAEA